MIKNTLVILTLFSTLIFAHETPPKEPPPITPSARGCPTCWGGYISAEFLYLKGRIDSLVYSAMLTFQDDTFTTDITTSSMTRPQFVEFKYEPGFRFGLGSDLPYDGWDLSFYWTYYYSHPSTSVTTTRDAERLITLFAAGNGNGPEFCSFARGEWRIRHNIFDLILGRSLYLSRNLSIKPQFGLKGTTLDQKGNFLYRGVTASSENGPPVSVPDRSASSTNNFFGIGPFFRIDTRWNFWDFGIFTNFTVSTLWGKFNITGKERNVPTSPQPTPIFGVTSVQTHIYSIRPMIQLNLGVDWGRCLAGRYFLNFAAGYELQYWWNQTISGSFSNSEGVGGDYTLDGLTIRGSISF